MAIGSIRMNMLILVLEEKLQVGPPNNLKRCMITRSNGFTRKGIRKVSRSVWPYVYLVLTSQVQARSTLVGSSKSAVHAQQVSKITSLALANEDYSISVDIDRYESLLEQALSKIECLNWQRLFYASK